MAVAIVNVFTKSNLDRIRSCLNYIAALETKISKLDEKYKKDKIEGQKLEKKSSDIRRRSSSIHTI